MDQRTRKFMTMHTALHSGDDSNRHCVSRKERGDNSPAFKIASMHWYKNSNTTLKTQRQADFSNQKQYRKYKYQQNKNNQKTKMGKKKNNKCTDISNCKQAKSHRRRHEYGWESENVREKRNLFWYHNYVKAKIEEMQQNSRFYKTDSWFCTYHWLCGDRGKTINHMIHECSK